MTNEIQKLRKMTGLSQRKFADLYGIPLSTLTKWEQGESKPAPYVVKLIAQKIPAMNENLQVIQGSHGKTFYYDKNRMEIMDAQGNRVRIAEPLEGVKEQNLKIYLDDLFGDLYQIQRKFNDDCCYDKKEDILWEVKG